MGIRDWRLIDFPDLQKFVVCLFHNLDTGKMASKICQDKRTAVFSNFKDINYIDTIC